MFFKITYISWFSIFISIWFSIWFIWFIRFIWFIWIIESIWFIWFTPSISFLSIWFTSSISFLSIRFIRFIWFIRFTPFLVSGLSGFISYLLNMSFSNAFDMMPIHFFKISSRVLCINSSVSMSIFSFYFTSLIISILLCISIIALSNITPILFSNSILPLIRSVYLSTYLSISKYLLISFFLCIFLSLS